MLGRQEAGRRQKVMTNLSKRAIAACGLLLTAAYCFLGAVQNGSFGVAGAADAARFHRNARIWFALATASASFAFVAAFLAFRARREPVRPKPTVISGDPGGVYVDPSCCLTCGVPWTFAPSVFAEGHNSCIVTRQPLGATELRRVLRVLRSQELDCVRYGGRDPRVQKILRRVGCAEACDDDPLS
jgi:hypothetical protein